MYVNINVNEKSNGHVNGNWKYECAHMVLP